ncbi:sortase [Nocardioides sp. SLBN-35]|uniref:sortase n=1 Tax=Nocardioides sp. SLBN-35 TaxID=2768445 RepID=UPI0011536EBE|nr:class E sortase [Nocardioides sp. SLBN-35]TQK69939.1 LPXTG-site transpeptidase (sortase) family protein [Nocardioides sp. SLBN-35]
MTTLEESPVAASEQTVPRESGARPRRRPQRRAPRPSRQDGPPSRAETASTVVSTSATMAALVTLWMALQLLVLGGVAQERSQSLLYDEFRAEVAAATASVGPVTEPGAPVALIQVPRLGLQQVVVEGTASGDLLAGPGHLRNTVLPGQAGASVVFGRAATYGSPFRDLDRLEPGDRIEVTVAQGRVAFTVRAVRRSGDPLPQPLAAGRARLTLVTAEGHGRLRAIAPGEALYVDAEADSAFPAPSGLPPTVPEPEKPMGTDTGVLPLLALDLALLLALTLGVIAARQRWSLVHVWVVATPLAIALAWVTTDGVMRLLPNLT